MLATIPRFEAMRVEVAGSGSPGRYTVSTVEAAGRTMVRLSSEAIAPAGTAAVPATCNRRGCPGTSAPFQPRFTRLSSTRLGARTTGPWVEGAEPTTPIRSTITCAGPPADSITMAPLDATGTIAMLATAWLPYCRVRDVG